MMEALTPFDGIAIVIVIVSVMMALARGFLRELATLGAFMAALAAAYYAHSYLRDPLANTLPETSPNWLPDAILIVGAFLVIYVLVAWFGASLSKNLQGTDGIGLVDRLAGGVFGFLRGAAVIIFFAYAIDIGMDKDQVPEFIRDAQIYPLMESSVAEIKKQLPDLVEQGGQDASLDPEGEPE
ncbi:MAG: CvpA family protein [Pseudomonadota bacterium]